MERVRGIVDIIILPLILLPLAYLLYSFVFDRVADSFEWIVEKIGGLMPKKEEKSGNGL